MTSISRKLVLMVIDEFILPELLRAKHSDWCSCKFLSFRLKRIPMGGSSLQFFSILLQGTPLLRRNHVQFPLLYWELLFNVLSGK